MGSRDHSYECEQCGVYRGGLNDLRCDCDPPGELPEALIFALTETGAELLDAMRTLAENLCNVAIAQRCFDLGISRGAWLNDVGADWPAPWQPGIGLSADHECKDCGAPMRTEDVGRFETCGRCAAERRASR